jgi:hypothetical protein
MRVNKLFLYCEVLIANLFDPIRKILRNLTRDVERRRLSQYKHSLPKLISFHALFN